MTISTKPPQLTLNFEPEIADVYPTLRAFLSYQIQHQRKPAKTIAGDMDMAPSTLSRKLTPADGDTQRFNVDDLEIYMRVTGDTSPIEYLASKYLHSDSHRQARLMAKAEALQVEHERVLSLLRAVG